MVVWGLSSFMVVPCIFSLHFSCLFDFILKLIIINKQYQL